jgi:hypothetical protein
MPEQRPQLPGSPEQDGPSKVFDGPPELTAKVDSSRVTSLLWQDGHSGISVVPDFRYSNAFPHDRHFKSSSGMVDTSGGSV